MDCFRHIEVVEWTVSDFRRSMVVDKVSQYLGYYGSRSKQNIVEVTPIQSDQSLLSFCKQTLKALIRLYECKGSLGDSVKCTSV